MIKLLVLLSSICLTQAQVEGQEFGRFEHEWIESEPFDFVDTYEDITDEELEVLIEERKDIMDDIIEKISIDAFRAMLKENETTAER